LKKTLNLAKERKARFVGNKMKQEHLCGINKFVERDIDMMLAEELRVNPEFSRWIMSHFGSTDELAFPAASTNVSVVEDGSEADVVATFITISDEKHRLFIEDKIDAILMPEQLERYVRRGEGEQRRGLIARYSVLFFTPSTYFSATLPSGVVQISFEAAAQELRSRSTDIRSSYRASLLEKALPLWSSAARDKKVVETDPYIKEWWDNVYRMIEREFPQYFRHKARYPRSVYFAPEGPEQAAYLRVDFKGHKGEVDLAFKNISSDALEVVLKKLGPHPGKLVVNGKSSAIQIAGLQPFVISDGLAIIDTKVRAAYEAAHNLLQFWKSNRETFDQLAITHGQRP
jgi:hypothetical protein